MVAICELHTFYLVHPTIHLEKNKFFNQKFPYISILSKESKKTCLKNLHLFLEVIFSINSVSNKF